MLHIEKITIAVLFYTIKIKLQLNIKNARENHVIILRGNPFKAIECCIWPIRDGDEKKNYLNSGIANILSRDRDAGFKFTRFQPIQFG